MEQQTAHIGDEELVLTAMGELPLERLTAVRTHLAGCRACRANLDEIERTLEGYVEARRSDLDAKLPPAGPARARLRRSLAEARAEPASWVARTALRASSRRLAVGFAALAALAGFLTFAPSGRQRDDVNARFVPDPRLTPGLTTHASRAELCASRPAAGDARVSRPLAYEVFRRHGVGDPLPRAYEIDYLIPPELGGAADVRNLWPQPYDAYPWSAHAKDALEDRLIQLVCNGDLELVTAQEDLAEDWTIAYKRYFRVNEPLVEHASFLKDRPWE